LTQGYSLAVGWVILLVGHAPRQMAVLAGARMAILVVSLAVTFGLKFKISIHASVSATVVVCLIATYSRWMALLSLLVVWVCWSQVELKDHATSQVVAGALLGLVAGGGYALIA
jgi:hypothetical protein